MSRMSQQRSIIVGDNRTMDCRLALSLFLSVVLTTIIHTDTKGVEVVEGPIVLHANIAGQWGDIPSVICFKVNEPRSGQQPLTLNSLRQR